MKSLPLISAFFDAQVRRSYLFLLKWVVLAVCAGIVGAFVVHGFSQLTAIVGVRLLGLPVPMFLWPVAGAIVAGVLIYRFQPDAAGEGMPSYMRGIRIDNGKLSFSVTFFKFCAALATIATFGNGGVVGPLGRVCAGILSAMVKYLRRWHVVFTGEDQRTAAICGLAAAVGTIFHASLGGGIFAVEIIQRAKMGYKDLFPAVLSSSTAVFVCKATGWGGFYQFDAVDQFMDLGAIGWLLVLCLFSGFLGGAYTNLYRFTTRVIRRQEGNVFLKVTGGSLVAGVLAWLVNPELLGTSKGLISALFSSQLRVPELIGHLGRIDSVGVALLILIAFKALANCITIGSGMSAGFAGPAAIMGLLLGALTTHLAGIPHLSATYYAFLAAGFAGMLASSMNVPIAAAIMATEIFGLQYSFPAGCAAVIGFQITRQQTIYDYALAGSGLAVDD